MRKLQWKPQLLFNPQIINRLDDISNIEVTTHESAIRIISKSGALNNPADRDHCLQYMIAIGLIHWRSHC